MKYLSLKRVIDRIIAFILIIILIPIFFILGFGTMIFLGKPILFRQKRTGYKCKTFTINKFRTLPTDYQIKKKLLFKNDKNHWFANFMRISSLDELPQLFNILIGNMSFVGPRPLRYEYKDSYNQLQNQRHNIHPGLTGWAQVQGGNSISWEDKFNFDIWYLENVSLALDIFILLKTFSIVISQKWRNPEENNLETFGNKKIY